MTLELSRRLLKLLRNRFLHNKNVILRKCNMKQYMETNKELEDLQKRLESELEGFKVEIAKA